MRIRELIFTFCPDWNNGRTTGQWGGRVPGRTSLYYDCTVYCPHTDDEWLNNSTNLLKRNIRNNSTFNVFFQKKISFLSVW